MSYLVVECRRTHAVAVDEEGRFLKIKNRHYVVGQTLSYVEPVRIDTRRLVYTLGTLAACFALLLGLLVPGMAQPYASVYVKINPEVRMDVNRQDTVVGLSGVNSDGEVLIQGYFYRGKSLDQVTDELVDRAIEMGYLKADGQITLTLDSQDKTWVDTHARSLHSHLQAHLKDHHASTIQIDLAELTEDIVPIPIQPEHHPEEDDGEHHGQILDPEDVFGDDDSLPDPDEDDFEEPDDDDEDDREEPDDDDEDDREEPDDDDGSDWEEPDDDDEDGREEPDDDDSDHEEEDDDPENEDWDDEPDDDDGEDDPEDDPDDDDDEEDRGEESNRHSYGHGKDHDDDD